MIEAPEVVSRLGVTAANPSAAARIGAAVVRDAATGTVWSVDANGMAPAGAHERMFRVKPAESRPPGTNELEYACSVEDDANVFGPLSVTVPGLVAGLGIIHERWGRRPWASIVAPSQTLLADGFPYGDLALAIQNNANVLRRFPGSVAHLMPNGKVPTRDTVWHRPDMEQTLAQLAAAGWRDFYSGKLGRMIADHLQAAGGIVTRADNAQVHCAILPNGGFSSLQALNLLESLPLPAADVPEYWHLLAEALKLAWRDRLHYVADPDFAAVPVALGVPGGRKIISVMTRAAQMLVDRDATGYQAATAPRLHLEGCEPLEMLPATEAVTIAALQAMGHQINPTAGICGVMNCAESLEKDQLTRGGSDATVAGAELP